jgi:acetyl esterase/lipase
VWRGRAFGRATLLAVMALAWQPADAAETARHLIDIVYARVDGRALALDLHLPAGVSRPPLVVYVHGGAWRDGDKSQYPDFLVGEGFAVASVDFRSSNDAPFPANVHDIKAAIRFLRARESQYGYRSARIAIAGTSSGGHLAALIGTTGGNAELEGTLGEHLRESSAVQGIVSWFGASNLTTILSQSTPFGLSVREPALRQLLGGLPQEVPALAQLASPVMHVDARDPPAMLLHGDQDRQMPVNQLLELEAAYRRTGLRVDTMVLNGEGHGGNAFNEGEAARRVVEFLQRTIGR